MNNLLNNSTLSLFSTPSWLFYDEVFANDNHKQKNVTFLSNSVVSKVEDNRLEIAVSVLGHDPKTVNVEMTEERIYIKAEKSADDKSLTNSLVSDLNEVIRLGKDYDGLSAKATINNGILHIVVEKKAEAKPKKMSIKF